jgi:hypothetical protein
MFQLLVPFLRLKRAEARVSHDPGTSSTSSRRCKSARRSSWLAMTRPDMWAVTHMGAGHF